MTHWFTIVGVAVALSASGGARGQLRLDQTMMRIEVGAARQLHLKPGSSQGAQWTSSAPQIAEVFDNGFVAGLAPGEAIVTAPNAGEACRVTVERVAQSIVDPASLKQFPDSRGFMVGTRKCFGSELNGQRAADPNEKRFTHANRVINPHPLRADKPLDWEVRPGTEVFDGAGVAMGTVSSTLKVGGRTALVSMFNFGASKVLGGRLCIYAFSVSIKPSAALRRATPAPELKSGSVGTSAWLPLDDVVDKDALLERIGLGRNKLPALPLEATGYRVTGGDPKMYMTDAGELPIVRHFTEGSPPVPSHYLRRPSGTVNLVYSVPGFGLGGEGLDSFLVSDGLEFYPARGAKVFRQPTYYPKKDPRAGKVAPPTMTFLYGAIKVNGGEPIYGWIAKEALAGGAE